MLYLICVNIELTELRLEMPNKASPVPIAHCLHSMKVVSDGEVHTFIPFA